MISTARVAVDPKKIEAIRNWPRPVTIIEVRNFMGLARYYRRFVKDFAKLSTPLIRLTRGIKFVWSEDCQRSFEELAQIDVRSYPFPPHYGKRICDLL